MLADRALIRTGLVLLTLVVISPEMPTIAQAPSMQGPANARDSQTALINAISHGDTASVMALINSGIDVNAKDKLGRTPIFWAAQWGRVDIIEALAKAGADVNLQDQLGWKPPTLAFADAHFDAVQALVKAGADRSQIPRDLNRKDKAGFTPLVEALRRNDMSSARALFQLGLDPNSRDGSGRTLLEGAAFSGNVELARILIEEGADVNASDNADDKHKWTPLLLAAQMGHADVAEALVKAGADPSHAGPGGWNALMQASYFGHLDIARILIPSTIVDYRAKDDETALMLARWACHPDIVKALINAGAVSDSHERSRAPRFEDFPVARTYKDAPAPMDLSSNPIASEYRTRIREAARKGPNFAGHLTVVSWSCGSNCEITAIVDALTGRVYDGIGDERGADYKIGSSLMVADPGRPPGVNPDDPTNKLPVRYYVWQENHFKLIYEQSCSDAKRECGCPELKEP